MKKDSIVQFVCFETPMEADEFILHWEQYNKLLGNDQEVTLQQEAEKKGKFRYVSQHRCYGGDFPFVFKKGKRSAHFPEVEMKAREIGGYTAIQVDCSNNTIANESKILVFVTNAVLDLSSFNQPQLHQHLNIYEAYYESSTYSYILEFFVENTQIPEFMRLLKIQNLAAEVGLYKECVMPKKSKRITPVVKKVTI